MNKDMIIQGTTSLGFNFKLNREALDDYELLEMLGEMGNKPWNMGKVLETMLGKEQFDNLKEFLKSQNKDKKLKVTDVMNTLDEIFAIGSEQLKN